MKKRLERLIDRWCKKADLRETELRTLESAAITACCIDLMRLIRREWPSKGKEAPLSKREVKKAWPRLIRREWPSKGKEAPLSKREVKKAWPRLAVLNIPVYTKPNAHVLFKDLTSALKCFGPGKEDKRNQFNQCFGEQTMAGGGPFPWDVEDALEAMDTGNRRGRRIDWD